MISLHEITKNKARLDGALVRVATGLCSVDRILRCNINGEWFSITFEDERRLLQSPVSISESEFEEDGAKEWEDDDSIFTKFEAGSESKSDPEESATGGRGASGAVDRSRTVTEGSPCAPASGSQNAADVSNDCAFCIPSKEVAVGAAEVVTPNPGRGDVEGLESRVSEDDLEMVVGPTPLEEAQPIFGHVSVEGVFYDGPPCQAFKEAHRDTFVPVVEEGLPVPIFGALSAGCDGLDSETQGDTHPVSGLGGVRGGASLAEERLEFSPQPVSGPNYRGRLQAEEGELGVGRGRGAGDGRGRKGGKLAKVERGGKIGRGAGRGRGRRGGKVESAEASCVAKELGAESWEFGKSLGLSCSATEEELGMGQEVVSEGVADLGNVEKSIGLDL